MLTYTPPDSRKPAKTYEKPWLLLLMVFAWLWPGVFSHDLWNPAEPVVFTALEALRHGASPLVADVLGQADFKIPPVYLWTTAAFQNLLSPWAADTYSAARFASVFFTAAGLACCGFAGFNLLGRHHGRSVVLILVGCVGLLSMAHFLSGLSVTFAALSMILCGFSLAHKKVITGALLLGGGWALLSLSAGFLLTAVLVLTALLLPLHPQWRFKRYALTLVGAFAVGLPLMVVYPFLLHRLQPAAFDLWLNTRSLGAFGGLADFQTAFNLPYYLKNLIWFAFPAWPLMAWTYTRIRIGAQRWSVLGTAWIGAAAVLLAINPETYQDHLVWLLPPMALLGAAQLDGLRRGAAAFINWFGCMLVFMGGIVFCSITRPTQKLIGEIGAPAYTSVSLAVSAVLCLPFSLLLAERYTVVWNWQGAAALLYLGIGCSWLAYLLWNKGMLTVPANLAGLLTSLEPIFGVLLAVLLLGEDISALSWLGILIVVASTFAAGVLPRVLKEKQQAV